MLRPGKLARHAPQLDQGDGVGVGDAGVGVGVGPGVGVGAAVGDTVGDDETEALADGIAGALGDGDGDALGDGVTPGIGPSLTFGTRFPIRGRSACGPPKGVFWLGDASTTNATAATLAAMPAPARGAASGRRRTGRSPVFCGDCA